MNTQVTNQILQCPGFHIDWITGAVTPVTTLSELSSREEVFDEDGHESEILLPQEKILKADWDAFRTEITEKVGKGSARYLAAVDAIAGEGDDTLLTDWCENDIHDLEDELFEAGEVFSWSPVETASGVATKDTHEGAKLIDHLESLLMAEHPNLRLKTPGKYNPDGERKILIRTRPGEGGWEPAELKDGKRAMKQWAAAGLEYPFTEARVQSLQEELRDQISVRVEGTEGAERSAVTAGMGLARSMHHQMEALARKLELLRPLVRETNLKEGRDRLAALLNDLEAAESTRHIKIRRDIVALVLKTIQADADLESEGQQFAAVLRPIELHIGLEESELAKDNERLATAVAGARKLQSLLNDDATGQEVRQVVAKALDRAEQDTRAA